MESDYRSTAARLEADRAGASAESSFEQVSRLAKETFGSDEKARRWLHRPTQALSGSSPLDVSSSGADGLLQVVDLLKRIDHGLSA